MRQSEKIVRASFRRRGRSGELFARCQQWQFALPPMTRPASGGHAVAAVAADLTVLCQFEKVKELPVPLAVIRVMADLIMHAKDTMPRGGTIVVMLRRAEDGEGPIVQPAPGAFALLCVSDTGYGMAPDALARAFSKKNRRRRNGERLAWLARAKEFADRVDGAISLASAVDSGTTVKIWIPLQRRSASAPRIRNGAVPGRHLVRHADYQPHA